MKINNSLGGKKKSSVALKGCLSVFVAFTIWRSLLVFMGANANQERFIKDNSQAYKDDVEFIKTTCHDSEMCKKLKSVRLSCVNAGDVEKCTVIGMDFENTSMCTENGNVRYINADLIPNKVQCFMSSLR